MKELQLGIDAYLSLRMWPHYHAVKIQTIIVTFKKGYLSLAKNNPIILPELTKGTLLLP